VRFAFDELQLDRLQATTIKKNIASRRLLERLGFTLVEANILEEPLHGGRPQPADCYLKKRYFYYTFFHCENNCNRCFK